MQLMARLFLALGVFLVVTGAIYGVRGYDYEGLTLILTTAGGALLVGGYLAQALQRATAAAERGPVRLEGEPHVGPTIWPLVFALALVPLIVGALGSRWVLLVGAAAVVVAGAGWVLDVQRQWQAHFHGPHAHGVVPSAAASAGSAGSADGAGDSDRNRSGDRPGDGSGDGSGDGR